jgi:KDO2-lipid IV(A) lauroyltransferase
MGRNLTEIARFPFMDEKNQAEFEIRGLEHLQEARKKGKGVCLLTLHLGNGDMATAGLALHGFPIIVISKVFKVQWINDLWFGVRRKMGADFIAPRNSSYQILKSLRKQAIIAFVLDQFMGPPIGVRTRFFGKETGTALGLAVIAQRSQAPVVPVYTYRDSTGQTIIRFEPEIPFVESDDPDDTVADMTQIYTDRLEDYIRRHPEQWMWVHRRWKRFRDKKKAQETNSG